MSMGCEAIKVLESKHMLSTLLFLLGNGSCTKMELYNGVSKNPRMPEKLEELVGLGLLTIGTRDRATEVCLTDKGRDVASAIRNICDMIG